MSTSPVDAVGELIRLQSMLIWPTPHSRPYRVQAPCLLQQLQEALGIGGESGGVVWTVPASRLLISPDAHDLWVHINTGASAWARHYRIDQRRYRRPDAVADPLHRAAGPDRTPPAMAALAAWWRPVAWDEEPERPERLARFNETPALAESRAATFNGADRVLAALPMHERAPAMEIPPVGKLLRAAAAQAEAAGDDEIAHTMTRLAKQWAGRIRTLLRTLDTEDRVWPIRGAVCGRCGATTAARWRHEHCEEYCPAALCRYHRGDREGCAPHCVAAHCRYPTPAIEVRLQPMPAEDGQADTETLRAYQECLCCGESGWLPYTSESEVRAA